MADENAGPRATVFGTIAEDYGRLRPAPCAAAVDWLLPEGCGRVLDLAAGAGTLTALLAQRVPEVVAVEPDDRMRAVLSARNPGVTSLKGTAEEIPLPDGGLDAVVVSSAWHWFDTERAVPEIARVLRPGGRLSVVWNGLDNQVPWVARWRSQFRSVGAVPAEHTATTGQNGRTQPADGAEPGPRRADEQLHAHRGERLHALLTAPGSPFDHVEGGEFTCTRRTTPGDAAALLGTYSRFLVLPAEERLRLIAQAEETLRAQAGLLGADDALDLPFLSRCRRATLAG